MSIYKFFIILGFIACDLFFFNAFAFNKRISKIYLDLFSSSQVNLRDLEIHNKQTLGISDFKEILIKDDVDIYKRLSQVITDDDTEDQIDEQLSVEILSDITYEENGIFYAEGNVVLTMKNGILYTDKLSYERVNKIIIAEGNIEFTKGDQFFEASYFEYDFNQDIGFIKDIYGVIDFDKIQSDLNLDISEENKELCDRNNIDIIDLPAEVGLLNSNNIRFKNEFSLDLIQLNFSAITKWRFKSERIELGENNFTSEKIIFTNDPYNEPQFFVTSNGFKGEIINGKKSFRSKSTFINFENRISIPIGNRTIGDSDAVKWSIGYDGRNKDGFYIMRNFDPIRFNDSFAVDLQPYFLFQRAVLSKTDAFRQVDSSVTTNNVRNDINFLDLFALDLNLVGRFSNSSLSINSSFNSLSPDKFYDAISLKANFLQKLYLKEIVDGEVLEESCNVGLSKEDNRSIYQSDLGIYTIYDIDDIYMGYGTKIINNFQFINGFNSRNYDLILDVGNFQADSLTDANILVSSDRYSLSSSFTHTYKITEFSKNEYDDTYIYTPLIIDQGVFIKANISSGFSYYSNSGSQSIFQASIGPAITYGNLKENFFDYTYISLRPEYSYKRGESPFSFDDFNNNSRLLIELRQQLFGPILIGFEANLNLNSNSNGHGNLENAKYTLGISRRAYSIAFLYDVDDELFLLNFNIFNFGYENYSSSF